MSGFVKPGENASNISNAEWKKRLSADAYDVTREHGTEAVCLNA